MATPMETNTEELQEILNTVYNLPMAGGGSSEPDLVIKLDNPDWLQMTDHPELLTFNSEEVINTYNKLLSRETVNCVLNAKYYIFTGGCVSASSPQITAFALSDDNNSARIGRMEVLFKLWYAYDYTGDLLVDVLFDIHSDGTATASLVVTKSVGWQSAYL